MRKLNALLYLFLISLVSLTACTDDDDDAEPGVAPKTFNINGKTRSLNIAGALDLSGLSNDSDTYVLVLTTTTEDHHVTIGLNAPQNSTSLAGTYTAYTQGNETAPNTFSYAYIGLDCTDDPDNEDELLCQEEYETAQPPAGSVTITEDGNDYIVDFDITFENNQRGRGNYRGPVVIIE
ncbi:hypothetical protein D770_13590 [Flammeovirgaceae bacterium 311]|nr:hypothetical protein D770_13590 [Flammeovirgaceae bacterium 311]